MDYPTTTEEPDEEENSLIQEKRRKFAFRCGVILTVISAFVAITSMATSIKAVCMKFREPKKLGGDSFYDVMFVAYDANVGPPRVTIVVAVILFWWALFALIVLIANVMLTAAIFKKAQVFVNRWVLKVSVLNAVGTNVVGVIGVTALVTEVLADHLTAIGVSLLLGAILQSVMSLFLFLLGREQKAVVGKLSIRRPRKRSSRRPRPNYGLV